MHVVIINGSPRVQKYSNTDKIITAFTKGMCEDGSDYELYSISDKNQWAGAKAAFETPENTQILIALPLFVECIPGLLLEFLETISPKSEGNTTLSFILQSGFAEGIQLRCGEAFLEKLPEKLGCIYGGTLVKGDNFAIRLFDENMYQKITTPYIQMGRVFAREHGFMNEESRAFTGPEVFSKRTQFFLGIMQKFGKKMFKMKAKEVFDCDIPLDYKPIQE